MSLRMTPLVQPKPSCSGYSPPPPGRPVTCTSYFSINFPDSPYTRRTINIQRHAMVCASGIMEYWRKPDTAIHWSGAHPFGASHRCFLDSSGMRRMRSEEHTSELQSLRHLVCRLLLEKKKKKINRTSSHAQTASLSDNSIQA